MSEGFWTIHLKDLIEVGILLLTAWAIWYGPQKAVQLTRDGDVRREAQRRKHDVFHQLMRTRGITLHPDHVMALNLIQLEFYEFPSVQAAYRRYVEDLYKPNPTNPAEADKLVRDRRDLLIDLIHALGEALDFKYDKRDLDKLSYSPAGWFNDEAAIRTLREFMIQVMTGQRALHIAPFVPDPRFPPPPATDNQPEQPKQK